MKKWRVTYRTEQGSERVVEVDAMNHRAAYKKAKQQYSLLVILSTEEIIK